MAVYYCWKSIADKNIIDSILFGFFSALGFLTHYSFVFLLLALTIYYIYLIIKKKKIIELNLFLPIIIFLLILIPHLNWLFENNFSTISYALDRTGIEEKKLIQKAKESDVYKKFTTTFSDGELLEVEESK